MKVIRVNELAEETVHGTLSVNRIISLGQSKTKLQTFNRAVLPPGQSANAHTHNDCEELFYFLEGKGEVTVGEKTVSISENDVVVVDPGEEHEIKNGSSTDLVYLSIRILL
jgi:mannose-6-phosphate isomerase-like protein (cupin superfamily)